MQTSTAVRYHFIATRMTILKKTKIMRVGRTWRKENRYAAVVGMQTGAVTVSGGSSKVKNSWTGRHGSVGWSNLPEQRIVGSTHSRGACYKGSINASLFS